MTEGYDKKKFCCWVSLLFKVEHIMGTRALPDIYTIAFDPATPDEVRIYQAKHSCPWYNYCI